MRLSRVEEDRRNSGQDALFLLSPANPQSSPAPQSEDEQPEAQKQFLFCSKGPALPPSQFWPALLECRKESPRQARLSKSARSSSRTPGRLNNQTDSSNTPRTSSSGNRRNPRRYSPSFAATRKREVPQEQLVPKPPSAGRSKEVLDALEKERLRLVRENMKLLNTLRTNECVTKKLLAQVGKIRTLISQSTTECDELKIATASNPERDHLLRRLEELRPLCNGQSFRTKQLKRLLYRDKQQLAVESLKVNNLVQKLRQIRSGVIGDLHERLLAVQADRKSLASEHKAAETALLLEKESRSRELQAAKEQLHDSRAIYKLKLRATEHRNTIKTASYEDLYRDKLRRKLDSQEKVEKMTKSVVGGMKCRLSKFEQTMNKIQAETGYKEIVEAMERFFSQSARLGALEAEVTEKQRRRSTLEEHLKECTSSLNQLESFGYEVKHDVNQIYEQEKNILSATSRLHEKQASLHRKQEILYAVVYGLFSLWKSVHINIPESIQKVDLDFICNNDNYQTIENLFEESIVRFSKLAKCDTCKDSASPFHEGGSPYKEITGLVISEKNIRVRSRRNTLHRSTSNSSWGSPDLSLSNKRKSKRISSAPTAQDEEELSRLNSELEITSILKTAAKQFKASKQESEKHKELVKMCDRLKELQKQTVVPRSQLKLVCSSLANAPQETADWEELTFDDCRKPKQENKASDSHRIKVVEARRKGFFVKPARSTG